MNTLKQLSFLLLFIPLISFSQNENNWWFFGENAGLDFNSGAPVAVSSPMSTIEGCSTLSDHLGNLIMYTDGRTIWDRNSNIMPGADNTLAGNPSSSQSALIYRDENIPNIALVFTTNASFNSGLNYTIVDLTANNGFGAVIPGRVNIPILPGTHEKVTGYSDPTNSKNWIITFKTGEFYAYEIVNSTLLPTPVISPHPITSLLNDERGPIKISPDGTKLAINSANDVGFIADFDVNTGIVDNPIRLLNPNSTFTSLYGMEFSPDSRFLYLEANDSPNGNGCRPNDPKQILQYDLAQANFATTPVVLNANLIFGGRSGMQIGPDGKIYIARTCQDYLAVIQNPTVAGAGAQFVDNAVPLLPNTGSREALPAVIISKMDGYFNSITGKVSIDLNGNGCDTSDPYYDDLLISAIDNSGISRVSFVNRGDYIIRVADGDFTVTPNLRNPSVWSITPASQTVSFPTTSSPVNVDFCVTPIGIVVDDMVQITPTTLSVPGFDTTYHVSYANQGNQVSSGVVDLDYDETVMTFVSASGGGQDRAGGIVRWNYSNFQPFDSENQTVTFALNRPTDTPALNGGDILNLSTIITPNATDADPANNVSYLDQTVVNAFDPNDIVCHEGEVMPLGKVGERIDYTIRFENLGTAAARNVVIRMDVDDTMFDKSSLVVESASHTQETNINREGQIEFIFRDINLDFNDATNDGFVTYSIKTQPTLVAGDQIAQQAGIYFDYNFPIFTNTYVTTIDAVASSVTTDELDISIYPVPATDILNVESVDQIGKIEVFTMTGQLVIEQSGSGNASKIDVSNLDSGAYILQIESGDKTAHQRFVKR